MSYVGPPYDWDVFISYAHGTPARGEADTTLSRWTKAFQVALSEDLRYAITAQEAERAAAEGRRPDDGPATAAIWYDVFDVDGNEYLTEQLRSAVERSAVLLIVMTGDYLASRWCGEERGWFEAELARRGVGVRSVFLVQAMPTDSQEWPGILKADGSKPVRGYDFFPNEVDRTRARPFGWPVPDRSSAPDRFYDALTNISSEIAMRLGEIKAQARPAPTPCPPAQQSRPVPRAPNSGPVYLAPSHGYAKAHATIRSGLDQAGVTVLPDPELTIDQLTPESVDTVLDGARVFAQVLGTDPFPGELWDPCAIAGQYRRACELAKPCVIYRHPHLVGAIEDPDHADFVSSVSAVAKDSPEEVVAAVIQALGQTRTALKPTAYLHCPRGAGDQFKRWRAMIEETTHCRLRPSRHLDENPKLDRMLRDKELRLDIYRYCDGVIFLNLEPAPQDWLRRQLDRLEDDRQRFSDPGRLRGLVLDQADNAEVVTGLYEDVEVIPWPTEPNPGLVESWLRGAAP